MFSVNVKKGEAIEPEEHEHDWALRGYENVPDDKEKAVELFTKNGPDLWGARYNLRLYTNKTRLLYRCDGCEEFKVEEHVGTWNAAQIGLDV